MLNNKLKNNKKLLWTSFGLLIFFSILILFLTIISVVTWNNGDKQTPTILLAISSSLGLLGFVGSYCLYLFSEPDFNKTWFIVFTTFSGFGFLFNILGVSLFLSSSGVGISIGMWFAIISAFDIVGVSFGVLINYLYKIHRKNPLYEKVLKDPEN